MTSAPVVYIVDDDESSRTSICALVRTVDARPLPFQSAEEFLRSYDPDQPGCLVSDVRMLGMSGIELQEKLREDGFSIPVIIITAHAETPLTVKAVKSGAITVLEKPCRDYELFDAIRAGLEEDSRNRVQAAHHREINDRLKKLSDEENQVLELIIEGTANKVIASRLGVSIRTVENRRQRIFEKTGAESLAELVRIIVERELAE